MGKEKAQKIKGSKEPTTPRIKGKSGLGEWDVYLPASNTSQLISVHVGKYYAGMWSGWRKED